MKAMPTLVEGLKHNDLETQQWSAELLTLAGAWAAPELAILVQEAEAPVGARVHAARIIRQIGPPAVYAFLSLKEALLSDPDLRVRYASLEALVSIGPVEPDTTVPLLLNLIEDATEPGRELPFTDEFASLHSGVACKTAEYLGLYGSSAEPSVPFLRKLLGHADSDVRIQSGLSLQRIVGNPRAQGYMS